MKKLMIALAAVAMAACAQAAAINWSSGTKTNGFAGPDGEKMLSTDLYTMTVSIFASNAGEVGDYVTGGSATAPNGGGAYVGSITTLDKTTDYFIQAVIKGKDSAGKEWTRETGYVAFTTAAVDNPSTVNLYTGAGTAAGTAGGNQWGAWQSVPEPTSGLLLLLGVAGLALRRRRV